MLGINSVETGNFQYHRLPPIRNFGWKQPDQHTQNTDWDSDNNVTMVSKRVAFIRKGCSCKTGCSTGRCKCKKNGSQCGPGCKCTGCTNLPIEAAGQNDDTESVVSSSSDKSTPESNLEDQVDRLMIDVFGNDSTDEDIDVYTVLIQMRASIS